MLAMLSNVNHEKSYFPRSSNWHKICAFSLHISRPNRHKMAPKLGTVTVKTIFPIFNYYFWSKHLKFCILHLTFPYSPLVFHTPILSHQVMRIYSRVFLVLVCPALLQHFTGYVPDHRYVRVGPPHFVQEELHVIVVKCCAGKCFVKWSKLFRQIMSNTVKSWQNFQVLSSGFNVMSSIVKC